MNQKESEVLRRAERLRQEQEKELVAQLQASSVANTNLVADAIWVRALRSRRDLPGERFCNRVERYERV